MHTHLERVGCHSSRYPVTVQSWIVTTAEAIWHLLYGESDAVLWQHTEHKLRLPGLHALQHCAICSECLGLKLCWCLLSLIKIHLYRIFFSLTANTDTNIYIAENKQTWMTFCHSAKCCLTRRKLYYQTSLWCYRALHCGIMESIMTFGIRHSFHIMRHLMSKSSLWLSSFPGDSDICETSGSPVCQKEAPQTTFHPPPLLRSRIV